MATGSPSSSSRGWGARRASSTSSCRICWSEGSTCASCTSTSNGKLLFRIVSAIAESERDLISERTKSALDAKRRRGERIGGRTPTHTPEQVRRAMQLLDKSDMTGNEIARAVGMSRSRMYALVARMRAEQEAKA